MYIPAYYMCIRRNIVWSKHYENIKNEKVNYRISRPIRRAFSPEKRELNSTSVLCAEGKYYFQT